MRNLLLPLALGLGLAGCNTSIDLPDPGTPSPTVTLTPSPSPLPSASPTPTTNPTPTASPSASQEPSISATPSATPSTNPSPSPTPALGHWQSIDFAQLTSNHALSEAQFEALFLQKPNPSSGQSQGRLTLVTDPHWQETVMQVQYLAQQIGGSSASVFNSRLALTQPVTGSSLAASDSLWLQYELKLDEHFDYVKGGKLPGLGGGGNPTGCGTVEDGFTARYMWREGGLLAQYLYYPGKSNHCGDYLSTGRQLNRGEWYTLTQQIVLNDPGQSNGVLRTYLDGDLVIEKTDRVWRTTAATQIDHLVFQTFFGGGTLDWAPETNQYSQFANLIISTASPLALVRTPSRQQSYWQPAQGYQAYQPGLAYPQGSRVYIEVEGEFHHFEARWYNQASVPSPLERHILAAHVGMHMFDNQERWIKQQP